MKIGIVTLPLSRNFGGILQNYALQTKLTEMGHESMTIDIGKYTWLDCFIEYLKYNYYWGKNRQNRYCPQSTKRGN